MSSQNFLFQYGCQAHTQLPSSVQTLRHLTAAHAWADSISTLHFWFSRDLAVGHEFSLHTDKNLDKNIKDTDKSFVICITCNLMDTFRDALCLHRHWVLWRWRQYILPKHWYPLTRIHEVQPQKIEDIKTSNSTDSWTFDLRNFNRSWWPILKQFYLSSDCS